MLEELLRLGFDVNGTKGSHVPHHSSMPFGVDTCPVVAALAAHSADLECKNPQMVYTNLRRSPIYDFPKNF